MFDYLASFTALAPDTRMLLIVAVVGAGTVFFLACLALDSTWGRHRTRRRARNRPATAAEGRAAADAEMARAFGRAPQQRQVTRSAA